MPCLLSQSLFFHVTLGTQHSHIEANWYKLIFVKQITGTLLRAISQCMMDIASYVIVSDGKIVDSTVSIAFCRAPIVDAALVLKKVVFGANQANLYVTVNVGTMMSHRISTRMRNLTLFIANLYVCDCACKAYVVHNFRLSSDVRKVYCRIEVRYTYDHDVSRM